MKSWIQGIVAVLAGCAGTVAVMILVERVSSRIYPAPEGLKLDDFEAIKAYIKTLPTGAFALVLFGWGLGTLVGSTIATRIAPDRSAIPGMVLGSLFLAASVANMLTIPHPTWVWAVGLLEFLPLAFLGTRLGSVAGKATYPELAG